MVYEYWPISARAVEGESYNNQMINKFSSYAECGGGGLSLPATQLPTCLDRVDRRIAILESHLNDMRRVKKLLLERPEVEEAVAILERI